MNSKKARALRKLFREQNAYSEKPQYKARKFKRIIYPRDPVTGKPIAQTVERKIIYNISKYAYRKAKKDYVNKLIKL